MLITLTCPLETHPLSLGVIAARFSNVLCRLNLQPVFEMLCICSQIDEDVFFICMCFRKLRCIELSEHLLRHKTVN